MIPSSSFCRILRWMLWGLFLMPCLLSPSRLQADEGRLYTIGSLSSSSTVSVLQDDYGFVWIATEYGLNRFDGYQFRQYYADPADTTSLLNNELSLLYLDSHQQLWVGSRRGLMRYEYSTDSFVHIDFPDGQHRITCLVERSDGSLVVGTSGYGTYLLPEGQLTLQPLTSRQEGEAATNVVTLWIDEQQTLWSSSFESKLAARTLPLADSTLSADSMLASPRSFPTGCGTVVSYFRQDQRGFYIVCQYGILYYDYQRQQLLPSAYDISSLPAGVSISCACLDRDGCLWLGTSGSGLLMASQGRRQLQPVTDIHSSFDLASANINHISEDREGNIWLSCSKRGIFQLHRSHSSFASWYVQSSDRLLGSAVTSVAPTDDGSVLCVVQKSGLYSIGHDGKVTQQLRSPESPTVIYRDHTDRYWIGSEQALFEYQPAHQTYQRRVEAQGMGISCITDDGEGHYYFGVDGRGLCCYDNHLGTTRWYSMSAEGEEGHRLLNDWIRALCLDRSGLLWIGTVHGLCCMNPHNPEGDFCPLGWDVQFRGLKCYALRELPSGDLLVGTESGLRYYDHTQHNFGIYPGTEHFQSQSIYSIVQDTDGTLWLTTPNSIIHFDPNTLHSDTYADNEDLEVQEYVVGAQASTPDGRIYFGNHNGITAFYPHLVRSQDTHLGTVYLTSLLMGNRPYDCRQRTFCLLADEGPVTMEFSMLDFRLADHLRYHYRLSPDDPWTDLPEGVHSLSFSSFTAGTYHLQLQASCGSIWSDEVCQLTLLVRHPWQQTWWFRLIVVLFAASLLATLGIVCHRRHHSRQIMSKETLHEDQTGTPSEPTAVEVAETHPEPISVENAAPFPGTLAARPYVLGNDEQLIQRIQSTVARHLYDSDLNIDLLCRESGISRAHLHRKMKELIGESPADYIRRLRLEEAKHLIAEGKINITQVAYTVGFNNQTHFSTVFRRYYGMSPSEYASSLEKDGQSPSPDSIEDGERD